jgi:hypothetical protein
MTIFPRRRERERENATYNRSDIYVCTIHTFIDQIEPIRIVSDLTTFLPSYLLEKPSFQAEQ